MAMRTPQPSANVFMIIIDNCERSFFQDRSDLRSDYLPLTALFHKCVSPDEFSAEEILLSLMRFDDALADHDSRVAIKTHLQMVNLEFGENAAAGYAFQISSLVHDPAIRPYNRAIFSLKPPCVRTVTFDACFRPFVLNLHARLLLLRMISHDALIVCQTNEQVNPACSFHSPKYQPQKLRVRNISARSLADNDCFQRRKNE